MLGILGTLGAYAYSHTQGWLFGVLGLVLSFMGLNRRQNIIFNIGFGMIGFLWSIYLFWLSFGGRALRL